MQFRILSRSSRVFTNIVLFNFYQFILTMALITILSHFHDRSQYQEFIARDPYCTTWTYIIIILDAFSLTSDYTTSMDTKLLAAAFDLRNSSWGCAFSPRGHWSDVRTINWCSMRFNMSNTLPASLLLNPDKSFRAFGYEAREQYDCLKDEQRMAFYFFQEITSVLDSQQVCITYTV